MARTGLALLTPLLTVALVGCSPSTPGESSPGSADQKPDVPDGVELLQPEIVATHPWDRTSFTQGLEASPDGSLLVGTGQYGQSRIYRTTVNGEESQIQELDPQLFGEGLTVTKNDRGEPGHIWQLTWKEHKALKRDPHTLDVIGEASYDTEGWGICAQQDRLVMSDGSGTLTFRDPETFAPTGTIPVTYGGKETHNLNELECTPDGMVWANVWQTDAIYRIDPATGKVTGVVDASGAFRAADAPGADVLNGIAAVPGTKPEDKRFYLTGKRWDEIYDVRLTPKR